MHMFDVLRRRKDGAIAPDVIVEPDDAGRDEAKLSHDASASDSDSLSLEARNEKEIRAHPNQVTSGVQKGVQKAEAAALVWSKKVVCLTYAWIWVCFFMLALQSSIMSYATVTAFATFSAAPAYTTASILANIIGGVIRLPIAKTLNLWGRAEGYCLAFFFYLIGMIILTSCTGPNSYAAGYVLYYIGYDTIYVILDIFIADTSGLRNRAFTFAFASTPFICTAFTGPLAADSFLAMTSWRWAIGTFCIVQPFVFAPLALVFKLYEKKAQKMGLYIHNPSGRTTLQSIIHYFHEFDIIGAFLLIAAFVLFLLPFSLATYARITYHSPAFIAMVVIGILLFPVFAAWEKFFARTHFIRWELFKERTVLGACLLAMTLYFSFYCWDVNYYTFVKVVYALPVSLAGYMTQIYNVGSCFWGVVFGLWVRYTKRFKYTCLFFGFGLQILGAGLMIHFRGNDSAIGYLIMCQIFIAFSGGTLVIGQQMAVMSASDREGVPMLLTILYLFTSVGGAMGDAVSISIFGSIFPKALTRALPAQFKGEAETYYLGGYLIQEKFPPGTPVRAAIDYAWSRTEFYSSIAATCSLVVGIPAIMLWKNYRVDRQQNKGTMI